MAASRNRFTDGIPLPVDRALSGWVPDPLRVLSFSSDQGVRTIWLKAEVDRELSEDEREDLAVAETEVMADNLRTPEAPPDQSTIVQLAVTTVPVGQPLDPLPDGIVILRVGEQAPEGYAGAMPHPRSRAHLVPHLPAGDDA